MTETQKAHIYFKHKTNITYFLSFSDLSIAYKESLVPLYDFLVEGKIEIPVLAINGFRNYEVNTIKEILLFGLEKEPDKTLELLFSMGQGSAYLVASVLTSSAFLKFIAFIKPYKYQFNSRLEFIKTTQPKYVYFELLKKIVEVYPNDYGEELLTLSKNHLYTFEYNSNWTTRLCGYIGYAGKQEYLIENCLLVLKDALSKEDFNKVMIEFPKRTTDISFRVVSHLIDHFKKAAMPHLASIFDNKNIDNSSECIKTISEILTNYDWLAYSDSIWDFTSKLELQNQSILAKVLATQEKNAIEKAAKFIKTKGGKSTLAYFVLGNINSEEAISIFEVYFHQEKNDKKVRQVVFPTAQKYLYKIDLSLDKVNEIIDKAEERGALKWKQPFKEEDLPDLFLNNGEKLNSKQIRFLFYRISFVTEMKSEPEAKLLLNFIDSDKSNVFAKHLLEIYLSRGSIAKEKYIMCLAGLLGDDDLLTDLQKLFKNVYEAKRMKMTQYVIGTMALIGTDKALRFIEYVSRKFKSKAALLNAAVEALENAADELGIDIYELSDRIIPDFGFDGLYKTIQIGEDEMRVFVAKDFKLQYITEDNKVRKSLPKAASKELKAELKLIQKEIREVNRAQKEKLEQYMVLERRWSFDDWEKFYLMNPVMFIYASTLVWGLFDDENQLNSLFYVDEDASLLDYEDDDIEVAKNLKIGIVHPLRVTNEEVLNSWNTKFYELEIAQPFDQLARASFKVTEDIKDAYSLSKYNGMSAIKGGRAVQGYFEKRGWRKEVSDGGCFDLSKTFKQEGVYAFLSLQGLCIGYYEEDVDFYDIRFMKIGENEWKTKGIRLSEIPEIVFSEVIADMEGIVKQKEGI